MVKYYYLRVKRRIIKFLSSEEAEKYLVDNNIIGEIKTIKMPSKPSLHLLEGITKINFVSYKSRQKNEFYTARRRSKPMPSKLKKFMLRNKYTEADIAIITGVSQRTVRRWLSDTNNTIPYPAWILLLIMYGELKKEEFLNDIKMMIDFENTHYIPWAELVLILFTSGELTVLGLEKLMQRKAKKEGRELGKKRKAGRPLKKS